MSVCVLMYTYTHIIKTLFLSNIYIFKRDLREMHISKRNDIFILHPIQEHNICHHLDRSYSMSIKKILGLSSLSIYCLCINNHVDTKRVTMK